MTNDKPIDIMQQFAAQAAREDMLAFFEFQLPRRGASPMPGLCKVSKPKRGSSKLRYLSLTFLIDLLDPNATNDLDDAFGTLEGGALQTRLPQVVDVVPMPNMSARAENYIREMDLLLEDAIDPGQTFVEECLIPAIRDVMHAQIVEVVWWANAGTKEAPAEPSEASLIGSVRKFLTDHLSAAKK